jgi:hypothetical protein
MKLLALSLSFLTASPAFCDLKDEPGPENGGLRLRLAVEPRIDAKKEGYRVRIDLINVSARTITLKTGWTNEDSGDVTSYLEAATSIECVPAVAPWSGGVLQGHRTLPQSEYRLRAGETLSARWETEGRKLKNRVTNPNEVQNPSFPYAGLYSVHATVDAITSEGTVRLRSNEKLVSVGGSRAAPRHTYGQLVSVDGDKKSAVLGLGSLHQVEPGDRFEIGSPKGMHWLLTISHVERGYSAGTLDLLTTSKHPPYREPPVAYMPAVLRVAAKK